MARAKDFLMLAMARKTSYEFTERKVPKTAVKKILEAARWAPSSHNGQPWSFIVVEDRHTVERVLQACYYGLFHTDPPLIIVAVLEPMHAEQQDQLKEDLAEVIANHKYMDISLPVVNMTYEAESLGISSCILSLAVKEANSILKVPEGCDAILAVGLGYEKKGAFQRARQRKELPEFVFHERYGKKK